MRARARQVSWLEAAATAFPGSESQWHARSLCSCGELHHTIPLTVAGPRRTFTGFLYCVPPA